MSKWKRGNNVFSKITDACLSGHFTETSIKSKRKTHHEGFLVNTSDICWKLELLRHQTSWVPPGSWILNSSESTLSRLCCCCWRCFSFTFGLWRVVFHQSQFRNNRASKLSIFPWKVFICQMFSPVPAVP